MLSTPDGILAGLDEYFSVTGSARIRRYAACSDLGELALPPSQVVQLLAEYDVRYVLIGGLAAMFRGWPGPTCDVDITPDPAHSNLVQLSALFNALVSLRIDELTTYAGENQQLNSLDIPKQFGLDVMFQPLHPLPRKSLHEPGAGEDFQLLWGQGTTMNLKYGQIRVASLEDIIQSKKIASRAKDESVITELSALKIAQPPSRKSS